MGALSHLVGEWTIWQ